MAAAVFSAKSPDSSRVAVTSSWVRADTGWQQSTYHMQFLKLNGKPVL